MVIKRGLCKFFVMAWVLAWVAVGGSIQAGERSNSPRLIDATAGAWNLAHEDGDFLANQRRYRHVEWAIPVAVQIGALDFHQFEVFLYDKNVTIRRVERDLRALPLQDDWYGEVVLPDDLPGKDYGGMRDVRIARLPGGGISAHIRIDDSFYRLSRLPSGKQFLTKQDLSKLEDPASDVMMPELRIEPPEIPEGVVRKQSEKIRVLVGFTAAAQNAAGGVDEIRDDAYNAISNAISSYAAGDVGIELEVAAFARPAYAETSVGQAIYDLYHSLGGMWLMDVAREASYADVMAMIIETDPDTVCGQAASLGSYKETAMFVVRLSCLPSHVFTHELGHLLWADHNPEDSIATPEPLVPYGHGYRREPGIDSQGWSTIMSVTQTCTGHCPRQNRWSSPLHEYLSEPTGTTELHDNARVLNEMKSVVANFYPEPPDGPLSASQGRVPYFKSNALSPPDMTPSFVE